MTDAQAAHLRALEALRAAGKVRTHEQPEPPIEAAPSAPGPRGGQNRRRILIDGTQYDSARAACAALAITPRKLYTWIDTHRATYA